MKIKAGKKYKIYNSLSAYYEPTLIHVDYVLENKATKQSDCELIVYRAWSKRKQRWLYKTEVYWSLCIKNEWPYDFNKKAVK